MTNLGIFIKNEDKVKFHSTKVCDMFTSCLIDPTSNEQVDYLDKEYNYIKKFLPIESLEMLQNRNDMQAIKGRAATKVHNLSINSAM
jgi:hypothetical protein